MGTYEIVWIDTDSGIHRLLSDVQHHVPIAIDTETAKVQPPPLNLLILARRGRVYLIDPHAIDCTILQPVFTNNEVAFHNASYDIPVLNPMV